MPRSFPSRGKGVRRESASPRASLSSGPKPLCRHRLRPKGPTLSADDYAWIRVGALKVTPNSHDSGIVHASDWSAVHYTWNSLNADACFATLAAGGIRRTFQLEFQQTLYGWRLVHALSHYGETVAPMSFLLSVIRTSAHFSLVPIFRGFL